MRVITPEEMARVDRAAIEGEGIQGLVLMENAGEAVASVARSMLLPSGGRRVAIWCGKGNNAGDGFVVARLLSRTASMKIKVLLLADPAEIRGDAALNLKRLDGLPVEVTRVTSSDDVDREAGAGERRRFDIVIDAIFGTGFTGVPEGIFETAIQSINGSGCPVLAVDIPSGVSGLTGAVPGPAARATMTVTFAAPKVGLVQEPGATLAGKLEIADIGIPARLLNTVPESDIWLFREEDARLMLPERASDVHKRDCGAVLVVGGSVGMTGAPALCGMAALRAGSGLVTVCVPEGLHDIMEVKLTEVMTRPLPQDEGRTLSPLAAGEVRELCTGYDVLALGPGLSTAGNVPEAVREMVRTVPIPVVLDADGLNALAGHTDILTDREAPAVLTPHPGEMARLVETDSSKVQSDRVRFAVDAADRWQAVVVLKGAGTVVAEPGGKVRIIASGNPGMATAGMGDVLTGCIASLIGQGLDAFDAASVGAFYHGHAADFVASMDAMIGMAASDVIRHLPLAMRRGGNAER